MGVKIVHNCLTSYMDDPKNLNFAKSKKIYQIKADFLIHRFLLLYGYSKHHLYFEKVPNFEIIIFLFLCYLELLFNEI